MTMSCPSTIYTILKPLLLKLTHIKMLKKVKAMAACMLLIVEWPYALSMRSLSDELTFLHWSAMKQNDTNQKKPQNANATASTSSRTPLICKEEMCRPAWLFARTVNYMHEG